MSTVAPVDCAHTYAQGIGGLQGTTVNESGNSRCLENWRYPKMIKNHWGITVDSEIPVTGVLNSSHPEWLNDDIITATDLDFEEHVKECKNEYHDDCYSNDEPTYLIGYKKNAEGLWEPDPEAEYSAIVRAPYTQVTRSKYVSRCQLCSPCFPGQGDLDNPGEFLAYTLPPDVWGNAEQLPIEKMSAIYPTMGV